MKRKPFLTTARVVQIFDEMLAYRRGFCADNEFVRMHEVWEELCVEGSDWKIRKYRDKKTENFKPKAGVVQFGHSVTLSVDERLFQDAAKGGGLSNYILAHELGHIALDHHASSKVVKNFQLFSGPGGMSIRPPTLEEEEVDYAAVFFQCGQALFDKRLDAVQLARKAFTDVSVVRKAQKIVGLEVFQRELLFQRQLTLLRPKYERVIL